MIALLTEVLKDRHRQLLTVRDFQTHLKSKCGDYANGSTGICAATRFAWRTCSNPGKLLSAAADRIASGRSTSDRGRARRPGVVSLPLAERPRGRVDGD